MKEIIRVFNQEEIRVVMKNGCPFFNAQDICKSLQLTNTSESLRSLEKDDIISNDTTDKLGRVVNVLFVSEEGLYDLIMKSRKKEARDFRKWITHEVLPSIRKTGKYSIPDEIKKLSTQKRNELTDEWERHGITEKHHYMQLTLQEYKAIGFDKNKRKKDLSRGELLLLSALESMEALKLFNDENDKTYYECRDSLIETGSKIKAILPDNKNKEVTND